MNNHSVQAQRRFFLSRSARAFVQLAAWLLVNVVLLHAQFRQAPNSPSSSELSEQALHALLGRIEQLEADDQQLRTRVAELEKMQGLPATSASTSDPQSHPESDPQTLQVLLRRIEHLESNDRQLLTRVAELERMHASTAPSRLVPTSLAAPGATPALASPPPQTAPAQAAPPGAVTPAAPRLNQPGDMIAVHHMEVNKTLLNIRGFGDFGLYGGNQKGETTTFSLGQLNLFVTSNISERFKALTELVFEVHQNNDFEEDLERILLDYSFNDYFKLSAGRYHTAIGYYNTAFHHTTWFQTATGRPFIFSYEDEGGILPVHNVGLSASGQIPSGTLGLHYIAEVGNGRASSRGAIEPVQNFVDENNRKSINLALFATPDAIPGSQVGFSVYRDVLYPSSTVGIGETIVDAYAVVARHNFEWLNEVLMIRDAPKGMHMHVFDTPAAYSQISKRFGIVRPYLRYEYVNASSQEPVFPQVGLRAGPTAGIRFDVSEGVALKVQYGYSDLRRQTQVNGKVCQAESLCAPNSVALQVGYAF